MIKYFYKSLRTQQMQELDAPKRGSWIYVEAPSHKELEHLAETYKLELGKLAGDLQDAETTIAMYDAEYCSWESARSLLSFAKQTMNTLNG